MTACNSAFSYKPVPADMTMIRTTNTRFVIVNLNRNRTQHHARPSFSSVPMPELPGCQLQLRLPVGRHGDQRQARAAALRVRKLLRLRSRGAGLPLPLT
jgi:hypothetical protein